MRRLILTFAVALIALSASASSQGVSGIYPSPPWCPTCFVASHADSPAAGSAMTGWGVFWFWGGVCQNGAWPNDVQAAAVVNGESVIVPVTFAYGGPRADVTAHLQASGCHGGHSVIAAWFPQGLPLGATAVGIRLHYEQMFSYHNFQVQP